jgi:hypothetical protein
MLCNSVETEAIVWSVVVWLTTLGASAFSIWNWRTLWSNEGESVADFAAIYRKCSLATIRAVRFGYAFLALQVTIAVLCLTRDFARGQFSLARFAIALALLAVLSAGFLIWFRRSIRHARRELDHIESFGRDCR